MERRKSHPRSRKKASTPDIADKAAARASPKTTAWMEDQAEDPDKMPAMAADFKAVLQAITTLTGKVDHIQANVEFIRKDFDTFHGRITEVEQRVSQEEDTVHDHGADIHALKARVKTLESHAEDAENRNRRNNLRILGLPEGAEGMNPTAFIERLLQQLLPAARFSPFFTVERAHRISTTRGPQGTPPPNLYLQTP